MHSDRVRDDPYVFRSRLLEFTEATMLRLTAICLGLACLTGCGGPTFTNLGNSVAVPSESIEDYATVPGISRTEARTRLREASDRRRIAEHAETYGISQEEAKRQLDHADQ